MRLRFILEFGHFESLAQLVDLRTYANGVAGNQRRASPRSGAARRLQRFHPPPQLSLGESCYREALF